MNPSELTEKSVYLRRLADQFDNLALEQIALDNRRAGLLEDFGSLTYPTSARPIVRPEPVRQPCAPPAPLPTTPVKSKPAFTRALLPLDNPNVKAILSVLRECGVNCKLHRDDLFGHANTRGATVKETAALSFYISNLKQHGLITNPERGYWSITEKGLAA